MTLPFRNSTPEYIISPATTATTIVVGQSHTSKITAIEDYLDAKVARSSLARFRKHGRKAFISRDEHKH